MYYTKIDFPGLKAGAMVHYSPAHAMYWVYTDHYSETLSFTRQEVEYNPDKFELGKPETRDEIWMRLALIIRHPHFIKDGIAECKKLFTVAVKQP